MYSIKKEKLNEFFDIVSNDISVFVPIKKDNITNFLPYKKDSLIDLDTIKTIKSPKDLFFPSNENYINFYTENKKINIENVEKINSPFLVFGVRACDEKSLEILDKVFLSNPIDEFYEARRKNGIIITIACKNFDETCFCTNFNIDASSPNGDIVCYDNLEELILKPLTEKGKNFIGKYEKFFIEFTNVKTIENIRQNIKNNLSLQPLSKLNISSINNKEMLNLFNSKKWEELSSTCLGCGSCTFYCPTCQCYDIRDYKVDNKIMRYRTWDSCMYKDFTLMAGGHTPRKTQKERFRQRFMHKLVYFPKNYGEMSCVGCGRCLKVCPNSLNIVKVIKILGED